MSVARTSRLSVRASPNELVRWNHIASAHGHTTTAQWIRSLLTSAELAGHDGPHVPDELRGIRHQLSRVGNNLNQLAHSANCGDMVHCGAVLDEIERLIQNLDGLLPRSRKHRSDRSARRRCERPTLTLH
ncbi:MobC family plasmid mobilization relaxosome protein [Acetobacter fabarum]|uniref:MobC family plasmid mobilization relaxosome protein n=1 Tax=Acetobacter fabarum TaxID=483199 RepID=UPI00209E7105|nr:MobC family plasmid mobilization relaxosome protein [Acetobacter fabarum]MCP1227775.1 MobC family plasmid mobilization relaxosome protein [Acetobacter fabarum]MCP1233270.1 MobC family plasmid mobilization relaxosome protein [Acetobacter fabarum]